MEKIRKFCQYCGNQLSKKLEADTWRNYCETCAMYFYENPLPVASSIVVKDREILLVKRKNDPFKGSWCLPMGFAESGETAEQAALRELEEETGVQGEIIDFVLVDTGKSDLYGDLLFLTFEVEQTGGLAQAGDDAEEIGYFALDKVPYLPFESNFKAIKKYLKSKQEFWAIIDSFSISVKGEQSKSKTGSFLSDKMFSLIESNAEIIAKRWLDDVRANKSTPTYKKFDPTTSFSRNKKVLMQFEKWLGGHYSNAEIADFYTELGSVRRKEGFALSEVISALSLTRKHIWEFALSQQMWTKTIDIYVVLELERRMMLFFDKASYYISLGYESGGQYID